jgi:signal transduction histidine kinase
LVIKSNGFKKAASWICLILVIGLVIGLFSTLYAMINAQKAYGDNRSEPMSFSLDFYQSRSFTKFITYAQWGVYSQSGKSTYDDEYFKSVLKADSDSISYFASNPAENIIFTNTGAKDTAGYINFLQSDKDNVVWQYRQANASAKIIYYNKTKELVTKQTGTTTPDLCIEFPYDFFSSPVSNDGITILISVRKDQVLTAGTAINKAYVQWQWENGTFILFVGLSILAAVLLAFAIILRKRRVSGRTRLSKIQDHIPLEIKMVLLIAGAMTVSYQIKWLPYSAFIATFCVLLICLSAFYFLIVDIIYNGKKILTNSFCYHFFELVNTRKMVLPLQKKLFQYVLRYFMPVILTLILVILFYIFAVSTITIVNYEFSYSALFAFSTFTVICGVLWCCINRFKKYKQLVNDLGMIARTIENIRNGKYHGEFVLSPKSQFAELQNNLNTISKGFDEAFKEQVQAEKLKVELITNVSHDLKTPLTSIISYADLLSQEQLTPENANHYVQIIKSKSDKLKNLVEDLFEISKAESGAITVNMQPICLNELLAQAFGEYSDKLESANLEVKMNMPEEKIIISADGPKMSRVLSNIFNNIFKYSMSGTRVYIDVITQNEKVKVVFKNISNYSMNFDPSEITERFKRGDDARSSEGSGLGLAIAKSFMDLQNGTLNVDIDGDLFKISIDMILMEST